MTRAEATDMRLSLALALPQAKVLPIFDGCRRGYVVWVVEAYGRRYEVRTQEDADALLKRQAVAV